MTRVRVRSRVSVRVRQRRELRSHLCERTSARVETHPSEESPLIGPQTGQNSSCTDKTHDDQLRSREKNSRIWKSGIIFYFVCVITLRGNVGGWRAGALGRSAGYRLEKQRTWLTDEWNCAAEVSLARRCKTRQHQPSGKKRQCSFHVVKVLARTSARNSEHDP